MNAFIPTLQTEIQLLERLVAQAEDSIRNGPEGTIYTRKSKSTTTFYHVKRVTDSNGVQVLKQTYIPIKEQQFISQLLQKRSCMRSLPKMQRGLKALKHYEKQVEPLAAKALGNVGPTIYNSKKGFYTPGGTFYQFDPGAATNKEEIATPYMCDSWSPEVKAWMKQPVQRNTKNPEDLKHLSSRGILTRSKSEAAIATMLESHCIPYKYDCVIELDGGIVSPDFTIMRLRDGLIIFWEHYGLVTKIEYAMDMNRKRTIYLANDITPWNGLIESYDDGTGALDLQIIEGLIRGFIL